MILSQMVTDRWRITRIFYFYTRPRYFTIARKVTNEKLRHALLLVYAPLSLLVLFGIWALLIMLGFGMVNFGFQVTHSNGLFDFPSALYYSGVTFLTLGYGDLAPVSSLGRWLAVLEAGTGLIFLASIVGYIPVFYAAVQRREIPIVLLDSKASSNPTGFELLRRHAAAGAIGRLPIFLEKYEIWGAELLEAYLAYPIVAFYRSQHRDQNWLKTATAIMDACALIQAHIECESTVTKELRFQAHATFASLRHAVVDLSYIVRMPPKPYEARNPSKEDYQWILDELGKAGLSVSNTPEAHARFQQIRESYEPYVAGISEGLIMPLPEWRRKVVELDNWQVAAWDGSQHSTIESAPNEAVK
jgi:hypothetical protein